MTRQRLQIPWASEGSLHSHFLSLGAAPDAFDAVPRNLLSAPSRDEEASFDDPSSVGAQPIPCVRPG
eukprot:8223713-Pyramimonas_sp.AAC.1